MSFCGLIKGISPKICILRVRVKINKRAFEPFCVWITLDTVPLLRPIEGEAVHSGYKFTVALTACCVTFGASCRLQWWNKHRDLQRIGQAVCETVHPNDEVV